MDLLLQSSERKDKLQKKDGAYQYYQKALSLNDQDADLWNNLGNVERELGRLDKAVASYERALTINPLLFHACLHLTHQKQHMCDWQGIEQLFQKICSIVKTNPESLISPFAFTSNPLSSSQEQLACANHWTQNHFKGQSFEKGRWKRKIKFVSGICHQTLNYIPYIFNTRCY